ncbi:hypothetical protein BC940DRAFT_303633 [Gongronella butleri]|nr:hypothetical protein BC940DRAFT_303633 [Gongronella butleri]
MSEHRSRSKWDRPDDLDPVAAASAAAAAINAKLGGSGGGSHRESGHHLSGQLVHKIDINNVKNRYSLTRGATQQEIAEQTGADVTTRGKYYPDPHMATDREPALHLVVTATDQSKLDAAIARINELIEADYVPTTGRMRGGYERDRYDQRDQRDQRDYRGGDRDGRDGGRDMRDGRDGRDMRDGGSRYGGGGGGGGGGYERSRRFHEDRVEVDLPDSPHYNIRAKIVGPQGAFVKYINNVSGCRVQVRGRGSGFVEYDTGVESSEPLYIHLS